MKKLVMLAVGVALLGSGCLRRFVATESRYLLASRYVFQQPVEEVWPAVRTVLADDGYTIKESAGSYEIVTEWREENATSFHVSTQSRYLVFAERLEADRCIIRFVRISTLPAGTEALQDGDGIRTFTKMAVDGRKNVSKQGAYGSYAGGTMARRDLKMEWKVLARVRPDIAAQSDAEIDRHLPDWLGEDPEAVKRGKAAQKLPPSKPKQAVAAAVVLPQRSPQVSAVVPVAEPAPDSALASKTESDPAPVELAVSGGPTVQPAAEGSAAASEATACAPALFGEENVIKPGRIVLMGETPGTQEIPRYVGQVACRAAHAGKQVVIGLEIPFDEQPALAQYVESAGTSEDRTRLLRGKFWRRAWQDGRSSQAVLELLEQARTLRAGGFKVSVLAFDVRGLGGNARQHQLASRVAVAQKAAPEAVFLVLTGNVQARIVSGTDWDSELAPMGARLVAANLEVVSLDAHYSGGAAWTCRLTSTRATDCSEGFLPAPQRSRILGNGMGSNKEASGLHLHKTYVSLDQEAAGGAHHWVFYLGKMQASPPAVSDPNAWTVIR